MFVVGNWKANGSMQLCDEFVNAIVIPESTDVIVCAPSIYSQYIAAKHIPGLKVGAQDCSKFDNGAYTGNITARMLHELGVQYCLINHSERIKYHNEGVEDAISTIIQCLTHSVVPILCIDFNDVDAIEATLSPYQSFVSEVMIAYEPVSAIGTGVQPSCDEIHNILTSIKNYGFKKVLYGGSVNKVNINELIKIKSLDGVLVGGASLNVNEFNQIIQTCAGAQTNAYSKHH